MVLEPARHLGDLGVGQPAVGLADVDQPVVLGVADRERVVAQDAVALAVPDLDADDDAIDGGQRLLHLQPAETAPAGGVDALGVLDHQALVAPAARIGEGGLDRVDVGGGDQMRAGEPAAVGRERELEGVEPGASLGQRQAQQRLDRLPAARPDRQASKATKMTGTSAWIAADGALRPSRPWSAMNGRTVPSRQPRISPSRMPSHGSACGRLDDLRIAAADVVQVARVEADLRAALVELGTDAVVLVLDPDLGTEPGDDLGGVLGRRGEHELERVEEGQRGRRQAIVAGECGQLPDVADEHARPLDVVERAVEGARDAGLDQALAQADPQVATEHLDDVLGGHRVGALEQAAQDRRLPGRAGGGLDLAERGGHLGEGRARLGRRGVAGGAQAPRRPRSRGRTSGRRPRRGRRAGRARSR